MKTYRLFFVSVYRFIWNTFLYDISSILLIIIFKLISIPFASLKAQNEMKIVAPSAYIIVFFPCRVVVHYKSRRSE